MKHQIPFRITVEDPPAGVTMQVQKGKNELLPPSEISAERLVFNFEMTADLSGAVPNFLGPFSQGPKDTRFVYINSGTAAGQMDSCWTRRAKISLMEITKDEIENVLQKSGSRIEARLSGVGRDGGPVCASVKGVKWKAAAYE